MNHTTLFNLFMRVAAISAAIGTGLIADVCFAQPAIYPAGGQTAEQQATDDAECRAWATGNTGVDPATLASQAAQQQSELALREVRSRSGAAT